MAKSATKSNKPAAKASKPQAASPLPTPATAKPASAPAPAKAVALRGGAAVAKVKLSGKAYRTAAPHNKAWWDAITAACNKEPSGAAVAPMLVGDANPHGVPAAFVGYALRRGYLTEVK